MFFEGRLVTILVLKSIARRFRELVALWVPIFSIHRKKFFVIEELKVIYIPVSKSGNTSVKKALLKAIGKYRESDNTYSVHQDSAYRIYTKRRLPRKSKDYFIFSVVRDEEKRSISCYKNKFSDSEKIKIRGFEFSDYLGGYLKISDTYSDFINKISVLPDRVRDEHFVSQYYWVCELHKANARTYHIDQIEDLFSDLSLFCGKNIAPEASNTSLSSGNTNVLNGKVGCLEGDFVDAARN